MTGVLLQHSSPRPRARVRLFCFPHAGVGASAYRAWPGALPGEVEVFAVQPPGRESRLREPPIPSLPRLVDALLPALAARLDLPYALFGHSMGAVVAGELARALVERGAPAPTHLFVSGRRPPHVPGDESPLHVLDDAAFLAEIQRRYGGIPAEVLQERELMDLLLPALRADVTALETHCPPPRPPLPCPITAFGGSEDARAPREHLEAWRSETMAAFRVRIFPGGHFYLDRHRAAVLGEVAAALVSGGRSGVAA